MTHYDDPDTVKMIADLGALGFTPHFVNGKSENTMYCAGDCSCGPDHHLHGKIVRTYRNLTTGEVNHLVVGELEPDELREFEREMEAMASRIA